MKDFIGMVIAIGFPLCGILAVVYLAITGPKNRALVDREIFSSYVGALAAGRYDEAWNLYDDEYKQKQPLDKFVEHYKMLAREYGPLKGHSIYAARAAFGPFRKKPAYTADVTLQFEKTGIRATYFVEEGADGKLRIHSSGTEFGRFQARGLPW